MSEISVETNVVIDDDKTRNLVYEVLRGYDFDSTSSNGFGRELDILKIVGVEAADVFNAKTANCDIYDVKKCDDGSIGFRLHGGNLSGPGFANDIVKLLMRARASEMVSATFHDQVGEYELSFYDGDKLKRYETSSEGEYDQLIQEAADEEDFLEFIRNLYREGKLETIESESERFNGYDVKIFDDEELYDAKLMQYLVRGAASGIVLFLAGWLFLDFFWTSLILGIVVAVVVLFGGAILLQSARDEYQEQFVGELVAEMEELGLNEEQAASLLKNVVEVMGKVEKEPKH